MDEILEEGARIVSTLAGSADDIHCSPCKSLSYGEVWAGRDTLGKIKESLQKNQRACHGDRITAPVIAHPPFDRISVNPQGHVYLSLNRAQVFRKTVQEVLAAGAEYGMCRSATAGNTCTILTEYTRPRVSQTGVSAPGEKQYCEATHASSEEGACLPGGVSSQPTVTDGRIILIKKLLCQLLRASGNLVQEGHIGCYFQKPLVAGESHESLVRELFQSFPCVDKHPTPPLSNEKLLRTLEASEYISKPPLTPSQFTPSPPPPSLLTPPQTSVLVCDGRKFVKDRDLHGPNGYDKNINFIQVRGEDGAPTEMASLTSQLCRMTSAWSGGCRVVHVTGHPQSFKLQQAMILAGVFSELHSPALLLKQHLLLCSGVEISVDGVVKKDFPLEKLMQLRRQQMSEACSFKYGKEAKVMQCVVRATTEAVVKFELLAKDPQSVIKLDAPIQPVTSGDVRFSGAFVLYNYARLASLLSAFQRACQRGTYLPLPDASQIDFSLLTDEEEWKILFFHVLHFPVMVKEICDIGARGAGIRIDTKIKKLCQFLIQMSHSISTYYSRVKVLMAPEPRLLPLIHARLALVAALRQVLYNGLQLLAIQPPEQL